MRVDVAPRSLTVVPGQPAVFSVQVFNTRTVISGHRVRVLGIDPTWVELDQDQLSLLPESLGVTIVTIQLPKGLPAGVVDGEIWVPAEDALQMTLDPISSTGGKSAAITVLVANAGNSPVDADLNGNDEENQVLFDFVPPIISLMPGERDVATALLK